MWIQYSDYFVPDNTISVEDLFDELSFDYISPYFKDKAEGIKFFKREIGYKGISIAEGQSELDMLYPLLDKMFSNRVCAPNDIDAILLLQEKPNYNMGNHIQYQYGLKSPMILNISGNECASFEHSLYLANKILATDSRINNILIATSVKQASVSARMTYKFSLNGDAAGIVLVGREKKDWKFHSALITNFNVNPQENVDTGKVLKHFEKLVQKLPPEILEKPYTLIFQNANVLILHYTLKKYGFELENLYHPSENKEHAHLYSLDLPIKMTDFISRKDSDTKTIFLVGTSSTGILSISTFEA